MLQREKFLQEAINISLENVERGGGPFGAIIVKNKITIASGANRVTLDNDPTAHAEIIAIREAAKVLGSFDLSGCHIYTSCEPCPMCLSAIYWARIDRVFFGNTREDAARIGFDDKLIDDEIRKASADRSVRMEQMLKEKAFTAFRLWMDKEDKTPY